MLKINLGRIKTYILILLVISSVMLSGSLWFDDYHGFSAFFTQIGEKLFSSLMNIGKEDIQTKYEKLFAPSKIIVNDGEEGHWILVSTQPSGDKFWKKTKDILKTVSSYQTGSMGSSVEKSEWSEIISKKSIIVKYNFPLSTDMFAIILKTDKKKINEDLKDVDAMAIATLGDNITFYLQRLKDGKYTYIKYSLPVNDIISDEDFDYIFSNDSLIKYTQLSEALGNVSSNLAYDDDVLVPIFSFTSSKKKTVQLNQVEIDPLIGLEEAEEIDKLVDKTFGGTDYSKFIKNDGTHIFIDEKNNTLKIYSNGITELEYANSSDLGQQEIGFESALKTAIMTIEQFASCNNLYITDIKNVNGEFQFKFDYIIDGIPVVFGNADNPAESAIQIDINKNYYKFKGFAIGFKTLDGNNKLSSDHDSIINSIFEDAGTNAKNINVRSIVLAYRTTMGGESKRLPVWVVKYNADNAEKIITVKAVKGG